VARSESRSNSQQDTRQKLVFGMTAGWFLGICLVLGVLATPAGFLVHNRWWSMRADAIIAQLQIDGDPVSIADLSGPIVANEENAAAYIESAAKDLMALLNREEIVKIMKGGNYISGDLTPAQIETIRVAFDAHPKIIPLLEQAAACQQYQPPVLASPTQEEFMQQAMYRVRTVKSPSRALALYVRLLLADGKRDEAMNASVLLLRLGRHFEREPCLVGNMVSVAVRRTGFKTADLVLRSGPISDLARDALEEELSRHDEMASLRWAFKSERVTSLEGDLMNSFFVGADRLRYDYLEAMQRELDLTQKTYLAAKAAPRPLPSGASGIIIGRILPTLSHMWDSTAKIQSRRHRLWIYSALQAHEQKTGETDITLAKLDVPADVMIDPFSDKPYIIKRVADDWVIYGPEDDLKDDDGLDDASGPAGQ